MSSTLTQFGFFAELSKLRQLLDAAKNHISELQENLDAKQEGLDAANQRRLDLQAECNETDRILAVRIAQLEAANQRIEELTAERDEAQFEADAYEKILDEIDRILLAPQQPTDKFTVILNSVKDVKAAKEAAETKLADARTGIENIAAQARLCLDYVGISDHQKTWIRNEISNKERIALAQFDAPIANDQRIVAEPLLGKLKSSAGTSDTEIVDWIEFFPLLRMLRLTDSLRLKDHPRSFRATVIEAMQAEKEPQP
jgi:flagellar biosynthesis chaperone FliJ